MPRAFLISVLFFLTATAQANTSPAPDTTLEQGMFVWALDEVGAAYDDVKLPDNTAPPFRMDAHIRAKKRYKNFPVGGLAWSGLIKLEEPGTYHVRVTTNVNITDRANWRVRCQSNGILANLPIGEQRTYKYYDMTGRLTQRVFDSRVKVPAAGAHNFAFAIICQNGVTEKFNRWEFGQEHYRSIFSIVEILSPSADEFRPLSSFDVVRQVKN